MYGTLAAKGRWVERGVPDTPGSSSNLRLFGRIEGKKPEIHPREKAEGKEKGKGTGIRAAGSPR
jgi:hypothetical protein